MKQQTVSVLLILLGVVGVLCALWLLAGYPWAIGVAGALALIAGGLLFDPSPPKPHAWPNNRGVR